MLNVAERSWTKKEISSIPFNNLQYRSTSVAEQMLHDLSQASGLNENVFFFKQYVNSGICL